MNSIILSMPLRRASAQRAGQETNHLDAFAQIAATHQSHSLATTDVLTPDLQGNSTAYDLPALTTYNGASVSERARGSCRCTEKT